MSEYKTNNLQTISAMDKQSRYLKGIQRTDSQPNNYRINSEVVNFDVIDSIDAYDLNNDRVSYLMNSKDSSTHMASTQNIRIRSSIMAKSPSKIKNTGAKSSMLNTSSIEPNHRNGPLVKTHTTERIMSSSKSNRSQSAKKHHQVNIKLSGTMILGNKTRPMTNTGIRPN